LKKEKAAEISGFFFSCPPRLHYLPQAVLFVRTTVTKIHAFAFSWSGGISTFASDMLRCSIESD